MEKLLNIVMLGVPKEQQRTVLMVIWRLGTMTFVAWACGAFAFLGLPGFLLASDGGKLQEQVARLQTSADISARISLAQEIRLYVANRCKADDPEPYNRIIERLQIDYERITGARYPEGRCS